MSASKSFIRKDIWSFIIIGLGFPFLTIGIFWCGLGK
jgi:hypothetical protein